MSNVATDTTVENYKGILQQYCHARNLETPVYETTQQGENPNEPSWNVTIRYGQSAYTTPEPIRGSKRLAEQITAKQLLETFEARQEAFLAGKPLDGVVTGQAEPGSESIAPEAEFSNTETLYIPIELVTSALGIANHRLVELRRGTRFRESAESKDANQVFAENLAHLTMVIVREVAKSAEVANIKFVSKAGETG